MPSRAAAAALLALLLAATGCGADYTFHSGPPPAEATPLALIYDVSASWPGLAFPEIPATGLALDMTLEIDPNSLSGSGREFTGTIRIVEATAGGAVRAVSPPGPFAVSGRIDADQFDLDPFGPFTIGTTALSPDLDGLASNGGRRLEGISRLATHPDQGTWLGIKQRRYLIACTDFGLSGTANLVTVRYGTRILVDRDVELTSGDPIAAASSGSAAIVNRLFFDNVQVLDPARGFRTAVQFSTGNGTNPHDALFLADGRVYVPRYEPPFDDILIADPATGAALGTIPLDALATNSTGTPRPDRLAAVGRHVLVTLQNIDASFLEYGPGRIAFIDPFADAVVRSLTLAGQNPFGPPAIHPDTGDIYLAEAGIFQGSLPRALTGGIEVIDGDTWTSGGLLVDDDDLGGNVAGVAVVSAARGWAVVVTSAGINSVVGFDPATGAPAGAALTTSALIPEIRYDGDGWLLVAVHDLSDPALRILEAGSGVEVARIRLSLPPASIAVLSLETLGGGS